MNKPYQRTLKVLLLFASLSALILPLTLAQTRRFTHARKTTAAPAKTAPPKFKLECSLPELTSEALPADKVCGNKGNSATNSKSARQNLIKNRFCLPGSPTTPIDIDFDTIDALQQAAQAKHIPFGRKKKPNSTETFEDLPPNRALLVNIFTDAQGRKLGEGSLVRLEGFIFKAQHSNTFVMSGSGESVNCNIKTLAGNDIHIALSRTSSGAQTAGETSECETVTAEITPHHRSELYNRFDTNPVDFLNGAAQKPGQDKLSGSPLPLKGARVRITGQLFFDGSHSPCVNGHGGPPRRSIWEVHPVFSIEVFDTTQNAFIPFKEWAQNH
jgi:hypothetical protein